MYGKVGLMGSNRIFITLLSLRYKSNLFLINEFLVIESANHCSDEKLEVFSLITVFSVGGRIF
jgi:hypothetical protein